ncbi:MAG: class I SAM-dependent methyltransferase [Phycisphaerales bacterium]|nr:class I SAM-dependent methyltransferase [Phycisphaerales bacterium]MCB9864827.1 class I SAM-dependent methyltransferase [Phycisphaerales bacterium]
MALSRSIRIRTLPARVVDRLRWEWREWHTPSRPSFQHEELDHALLDLIPWRIGERVLDVGCAHGSYLRQLANRQVAIHGLDVSTASLRRAIQYGRPLVAASGERLPFADESFETVLCHKTMYLFRTPEAALEEFARVLRPGGRIVFSTSATRTPYALIQQAAVRILNQRNWSSGNRLGPAAWVRTAKNCGFDQPHFYSCNLVAPIVFRMCDRWIVPNEWMRRVARTVRRVTGTPIDSARPHRLAQDFFVVMKKKGVCRSAHLANGNQQLPM